MHKFGLGSCSGALVSDGVHSVSQGTTLGSLTGLVLAVVWWQPPKKSLDQIELVQQVMVLSCEQIITGLVDWDAPWL